MIRKISLNDKFNFYEYLSVMLDGGVSISETLQGAEQKTRNKYFRDKISMISTYVSSGDSLSKSMKKAPQVFSKGEISIIESGETTGKLSACLSQLSINMRKTYDLKQKIKGALTYPLIIFIFLVLAIVIVLTYVIPTVSQLFEGAGVELPLATKLLLATSNFVTTGWLYILFFMTVIIGFMSYYLHSEKGKANFDYFVLSLPLIGPVLRNYMLSSIATNLGSLVGSGVPIVQSFSLVATSLDNSVYESYLLEIKKRVSQGEKIVESMMDVDPTHRFFPQDFTQLLSVGEKTASIDTISVKLADQFTREVDYSLNNLTKWIEPIAIFIAGIFVMWFAFAIFGAIMKVTQVVG